MSAFSALEHEHGLQSPFVAHHLPSLSPAPVLNYALSLPSAQERPLFYVGVYAGIGLATAIVSITSVIAQYTGALRASRVLFRQLLVTVVRATMRWHDTTPQGTFTPRYWLNGRRSMVCDRSYA